MLEAARRDFNLAVAEKARDLLELQLRIAAMGPDAPSAANAAIESLLDRAFGKATQHQVIDEVRPPTTIINVFAPDTAPTPKTVRGEVLPALPPKR